VRDITERLMTERELQSLTTQLMVVQDEERRRIARELHDDINQRIALLVIDMEGIASAPSIPAGQTREITQSVAERLAKISDDVRHMAYRFHPYILDDLGLSAALSRLIEEWSTKTGIKVVVVKDENADSLPRRITSCLYRVTQECFANIMKYSRAGRVELELNYEGQEVRLMICDNGVGFDLQEAQIHHSGLGFVSMRERLRSVRGQLTIKSEPGRGTSITVRIPVSEEAHDETTDSLGR
jgi:signal transduction histidine kinase